MAPHTTIFQFLTHPNPTVNQRGRGTEGKNSSLSNTTNQDYANPVKVVEWAEMKDLRVFREVFGGKLFEEAHREGRELKLPHIRPSDRNVVNEKRASNLFNKWNKEVVMYALDPILETYRPLIWDQGENLAGITLSPPGPHPRKARIQPTRASVSKRRKNRRRSLNRLEPDSGSIASYPDSPGEEGQEKFLKEYKVAAKWKSSWIKERRVINESGTWRGVKNTTSWPIMQVFTYCVKFLCRYACIVTCEEVFLFRVRPLSEDPGSEDPKLLRESLANNGLLEYVSVPWSNHCQSDPKAYNEWTVNLILWFIHVVGGNSSNAQWKYQTFEQETALPSKHLRLQDRGLSPIEEVSSDNSEYEAENSIPLSSAGSVSPVREDSSKDPKSDSQTWRQSSEDKIPSDGITPSDPKQSLDGQPHSDGIVTSDSEKSLSEKTQSATASSDTGAPTKRKRRREDPDNQISTEADNDGITARHEPKRSRRHNLRRRTATSPKAGQ